MLEKYLKYYQEFVDMIYIYPLDDDEERIEFNCNDDIEDVFDEDFLERDVIKINYHEYDTDICEIYIKWG